jgi:ParB-like chromosome segregation protein Spo0J
MGKSKPSWRDHLAVHEAAELFPLMSAPELRELGEDIRKNKLVSPIVFFRGKLLDGRNRLDAMEAVGIRFEIWRADKSRYELSSSDVDLGWPASVELDRDADPYAFVIAANMRRRHLTAEQRREVVEKLIKQTPEKSDRQIAEQIKASPSTVGKVRKGLERTGDVSKLDTRTDTKGRRQPAHKANPSGNDVDPRKACDETESQAFMEAVFKLIAAVASIEGPAGRLFNIIRKDPQLATNMMIGGAVVRVEGVLALLNALHAELTGQGVRPGQKRVASRSTRVTVDAPHKAE